MEEHIITDKDGYPVTIRFGVELPEVELDGMTLRVGHGYLVIQLPEAQVFIQARANFGPGAVVTLTAAEDHEFIVTNSRPSGWKRSRIRICPEERW